MTVCWHHLLFQFSNFEFPNLAFTLTQQIETFKLSIISDKSKKIWILKGLQGFYSWCERKGGNKLLPRTITIKSWPRERRVTSLGSKIF
jgi:hypothetical protein